MGFIVEVKIKIYLIDYEGCEMLEWGSEVGCGDYILGFFSMWLGLVVRLGLCCFEV